MRRFEVARRAAADLQEIWDYIAEDSPDTADRVLEEIFRTFDRLVSTPGMGHRRQDLTPRDVLFWTVYSYMIVYQDTTPLRVVRVAHGSRDIKTLLGNG